MTNGGERLDRIENILEQVVNSLQGVAARQQYHDEAFERHDSEMKSIREAIAADAENIRALVRIAELHHRRLEGLEGGEPV
jgi:peptidoglycan hydrolase CwlO-like protein